MSASAPVRSASVSSTICCSCSCPRRRSKGRALPETGPDPNCPERASLPENAARARDRLFAAFGLARFGAVDQAEPELAEGAQPGRVPLPAEDRAVDGLPAPARERVEVEPEQLGLALL